MLNNSFLLIGSRKPIVSLCKRFKNDEIEGGKRETYCYDTTKRKERIGNKEKQVHLNGLL